MTERNVLVVDWSANSKPKTGADSIWIGDAYGNRVNPSTRVEAIEFLKRLISSEGNEKRKWLIAFDFSFGVPWWPGREGEGGLDFWKTVRDRFFDSGEKRFDFNNKAGELRWEVANGLNRDDFKKKIFWGCPKDREKGLDDLSSKKGDREGITEMRSTDDEIRDAKSPWQLLGNGSVGSQMLMGICHLEQWRKPQEDEKEESDKDAKDDKWAGKISVWPFDDDHQKIVFAETFPSDRNFQKLQERMAESCCGLVKDAVQVTSAAWYLQSDLDNPKTQLLNGSHLSESDSGNAKIEGKILPSKNELSEFQKKKWESLKIDELILGQDQVKWTNLLDLASKKIKNPSEQCPPKRTTPD